MVSISPVASFITRSLNPELHSVGPLTKEQSTEGVPSEAVGLDVEGVDTDPFELVDARRGPGAAGKSVVVVSSF